MSLIPQTLHTEDATMKARFLFVIGFTLLPILAGCVDSPKSTVAKKAPIKTRETINKKTQNVLKLDEALKNGGVLAETGISVSDPLTQSAEAYRTSVGKIGAMAVEHAIQIRNAQNIADPKPLSYDELMSEIIKKDQPDGMQLAMLPYYQEYAWDEPNQKLVVVEFPEKKAQRRKEDLEERGY